MKTKVLISGLMLSLITISCQDSVVEELEGIATTRSVDADMQEAVDHYWYFGKKIPVTRLEKKSFVMFEKKDAEALSSSLAKNGIRTSMKDANDCQYVGIDLTEKVSKSETDRQWIGLDIDVKTANELPEVVYAAPYYRGEDGYEFPMSDVVYVVLKDRGDLPQLEEMAELLKVTIIGESAGIKNLFILSCDKTSEGNSLEVANILYESGKFEIAEPDFISLRFQSNDTYYSQQWNLQNTGQYGSNYSGIDIKFSQAQSYMPSSSNIVVGVLDSGVQLNHPDLSLNSYSWNAVQNNTTQYYNSHGTNVAGIISAITGNSAGVAGIASSAGVTVMSINIGYGTSYMTASVVSSAINYAVAHGAHIINMSWNTQLSSVITSALTLAVSNGRSGKGCILVCSTGNNDNSTVSYPATFTPQIDILTVGAISYDGKRKTKYYSPDNDTSWGSNYGNQIDLVAPGVKIPTTTTGSSYISNFSGTSAAAAHVSAVAALVLAEYPNLTYKEVEYILQASATKLSNYSFGLNKFGGSWDIEVGNGLLNAYAALSMANSITTGYIQYGNPLSAGGSGYVGTTLTASPYSTSYTYLWTAEFVGSCDRYFIWPSGAYATGPSADVSVYLSSSQSGTLIVTYKVFNGTTFLSSTNLYITVTG